MFELREAARFAGYTYEAFIDLNPDEKAGIVAHYRTHNRLETAVAVEQQKKAERERRRRSRKQ